MSLEQFILDSIRNKSKEIAELDEFQKLLDETQDEEEEVYMISFAASK
jgi:hypothetical protein